MQVYYNKRIRSGENRKVISLVYNLEQGKYLTQESPDTAVR